VSGTLSRSLRRLDIVALTFNNIVGAGIFTLPAVLVAALGLWSIGALLLAISLVAVFALCTIEVASRYDVTGGPMHYASVAFGPPAGFVVGWLWYLSRVASFAAISTIMLDYGSALWPALELTTTRVPVITIFITALVAINVRGVVQGALATNILTLGKGIPLMLLAIAGLWFGDWTSESLERLPSLEGLSGAVLIAFWACMGFEPATVIAGEAKNPGRDLPVGLLGGVLGAGGLYLLLLLACFHTVPDLANSVRPLSDAAAALIGPAGAVVVALTAVISCAGSMNGGVMVTPRMLYALSARGDLPRMLASVHSARRTPWIAIVMDASLAWFMVVTGTFVYLATFAAISRMLAYASTGGALIALRRREGPAPISIPLGPLLAVAAILIASAVLGTTTGTAVRDVSIAIALGWIVRTLTRGANRTRAPDVKVD